MQDGFIYYYTIQANAWIISGKDCHFSAQYVNCSIFLNNTSLIVTDTQQQTPVIVTSTTASLSHSQTSLDENNLNSQSANQNDLTPANLNSTLQNFLKEFSSKIESNNDSRDKILLEKMSLMLKQHKKRRHRPK
ncbi:unnamed protein product [Brachionus calyciflorus]|uniref:Uncharacterized protein n=1 Tax=Brachionus calyciflorus TaxID=104777 RepID=A0A813Y3Q0_9BILA|nr:unnamed protein product [Brachionus calyciflorus]